MPSYLMTSAGTPALPASSAYSSPSSRSGSYSAVITVAAGRPARSPARNGDASGFAPSSGVAVTVPSITGPTPG